MNGREIKALVEELRPLIESWLAELRLTMTSKNSTAESGAHSVPCPTAVAPTGAKASTVANAVVGFSFRETTDAAGALVILRDGTDATGDVVVEISLAAGESVGDWFGERGIAVVNGLYVDRVSGSTEGAVWMRGGGVT